MHYKRYKSILSAKNNMNIYRGCSHGCIYCDSRSACYHIDHVFEDIEVKEDAPLILETELKKRRKRCMISTGSMCDPYIPLEKDLQYTRQCLEVIERYGFGVAPLTKSADILRDLDLLKRINEKARCVVQMTLTTADEDLCKKIEPHVSTTKERVEALKTLKEAGITTVVWLSPILPFINDTEENLRGILDYCVEARVDAIIHYGFGMTLREGNREYYYEQLDARFPGVREQYEKRFGESYVCSSPNNYQLTQILIEECKQNNILLGFEEVFEFINLFEPEEQQLSLF